MQSTIKYLIKLLIRFPTIKKLAIGGRLRKRIAKYVKLVASVVGAVAPEVIAGQVDVLSAQRRQILQQRIIDSMTIATQPKCRTLQIDRVPQHDGLRYQVEAAGPVTLLLKAAVADFPQAVEEHGMSQRVACFALVQTGMHAAAQFHAL